MALRPWKSTAVGLDEEPAESHSQSSRATGATGRKSPGQRAEGALEERRRSVGSCSSR
jgi:hypothetical protein